MNLMRAVPVLLFAGALWPSVGSSSVQAASFDCGAAATPFERAICDSEELSRADEVLAKAFNTALGGLTRAAETALRKDQRAWLDFAQRACTEDAELLESGSYDERGVSCLMDLFNSRVRTLELSRMIDGHRFVFESAHAALPDPMEADDPDSYWKVATHKAAVVLLDGDDPLADAFNAFTRAAAEPHSEVYAGGELEESSDTSMTLAVKSTAGTNRISMTLETYWFGHGAAHGNYANAFVHYFVPEERAVEASDIFAGEDWEAVLVDAAWTALQEQHGEWLQVDSKEDIAEIVVDPARWDLDDGYSLLITFQPYEVSAYAYGAPEVRVPWQDLEAIAAENQQTIRYGW
ncbi:DUF3298 domain-containing protein [Devosia albogilva]|uniref:DUF3298 domain-containing protein n=1 Tax=Devosia albogilva TaxID=429726 RepID=A0ABW5QIR3_9HYPH